MGGRHYGAYEMKGAAAKPRMWLADTALAATRFAGGAKAKMTLADAQPPLGEQVCALRRKAAVQGRQLRSGKRELARAQERLVAATRALGEKEAEAERARGQLAARLELSSRELAAAAAALRERDAIIEGLRSRVGGKEAEAEPEGEAEVTLVQSAARPERVLRELAAAAGALESGGSPAPSSPQERAALPAPAASAAQPPARPASPHGNSPVPRPPPRRGQLSAPVRRLSGAGRVVISEGIAGGAASAAGEGSAPAAPLECSPLIAEQLDAEACPGEHAQTRRTAGIGSDEVPAREPCRARGRDRAIAGSAGSSSEEATPLPHPAGAAPFTSAAAAKGKPSALPAPPRVSPLLQAETPLPRAARHPAGDTDCTRGVALGPRSPPPGPAPSAARRSAGQGSAAACFPPVTFALGASGRWKSQPEGAVVRPAATPLAGGLLAAQWGRGQGGDSSGSEEEIVLGRRVTQRAAGEAAPGVALRAAPRVAPPGGASSSLPQALLRILGGGAQAAQFQGDDGGRSSPAPQAAAADRPGPGDGAALGLPGGGNIRPSLAAAAPAVPGPSSPAPPLPAGRGSGGAPRAAEQRPAAQPAGRGAQPAGRGAQPAGRGAPDLRRIAAALAEGAEHQAAVSDVPTVEDPSARALGRGAYGVVRAALLPVVVKRAVDARAERALREEVRMLRAAGAARHLPGAEYIVQIHAATRSAVVMEKCLGDLDQVHPRAAERSRFAIQLLRGLEYLRILGIVHQDLKCANVLVSTTRDVRLADFGNAQFEGTTTVTACTVYWRAPEALLHGLGPRRVLRCAEDWWAAGLVICQIYHDGEHPLRPVLRPPGEWASEQHMLRRCEELTGEQAYSALAANAAEQPSPGRAACIFRSDHCVADGEYRKYPQGYWYYTREEWQVHATNWRWEDADPPQSVRRLCEVDPEAREAVRALCHIDPARRLTPAQAMACFAQFR
eukprot:TRINITY_DN14658_c0_g1_i1.p1 TRINITY_DN14658_c0_g1~~TRINITY_DN14658_c0_g1_i1.p1  ORF type:complete len:989 (+),score=208.21 TRINITY_DN14658_c0_g1_i1:101-2968(+)